MRHRQSFWIPAILLLALSTAVAQFSSNVQGVVQDASRSAVPDASVRIRNVETGIVQETRTGDAGYYRFTSLQPGKYALRVEKTGFQTGVVELNLTTGQTGEVNVVLEVARSAESVEVTAQAPVLDTADSRVQVTLRTQTLSSMPIQGRNFLSLVAVAPGVTGIGSPGGDNFANEATPDISGNGRNPTGNLYSIDGLSTNSNITSGTTNLNPNPDAIQEMAVETSNFTVDQSNSSSVVVAMTSKSGTNQFHGSGSYYFTNQDLRARSVFTQSYEPFKRHDLSGTFGGPVIKNRTFAFASVQPLWSASSLSNSSTTYESPEFVAWAQQNFPNTLGTQILKAAAPVGVNTTGVAKYASDLFPDTCGTGATFNLPCTLPMIDQGTEKPSPFHNGLQYSARGDQYLRDSKERIYFNYYRMTLDDQNPAIRTGMQSVNTYSSRALQANWTHTFSPALLNEFTFGGSMVDGTSVESAPFHIPDVNVTGVGTNISPGWSGMFTQHNYNWRDVVSWIRGSHSIKFGGQITWGDDWADFTNNGNRPSFEFNSLLDLVQDKPYSQSAVAYDPLTGQPAKFIFGAKTTGAGVFVQDEWKVKSNLTLTLGIRWDDFGNPVGIKGMHYTNYVLGGGSTIDQRIADTSLKTREHPFNGRLNNNWSPRLGYAWSPGSGGIWSIRGGIGLYHDPVLLGESVDLMRSNPPGFVYPTFRQDTEIKPIFSIGNSDTYPFGFTLPAIPAGALDAHGGLAGARADVGGTSSDLHAPTTLNYVVGVERQLKGRTVVGLNYSGSRTWDGLVGSDFNRTAGDLLDGSYDRLNPSFGAMNYVFNANSIHYNAMIATVRKELASRGSLQASYTLSKVTDLYQGGDRSTGYETIPDQHVIYDSSLKESLRSEARWDHRHRFALSGSYELPVPFGLNGVGKRVLGGWQITMLAVVQSGGPYSVRNTNPFDPVLDASGKVVGLSPSSGDYNADGMNFDYPNFSGSPNNSHSRQDYLNRGIFNPADFTAPAPGNNGTEKRNLFRNPGYFNIDSSVIKNNRLPFLGEQANLQLKFDFFNVLNRVNLGSVDADMFSSTFGMVTSTQAPRVIQLGVRLAF